MAALAARKTVEFAADAVPGFEYFTPTALVAAVVPPAPANKAAPAKSETVVVLDQMFGYFA